jgi:hypothetical protein
VTTWGVARADEPAARRLLLAHSTNLDGLEHDPVRVLVSSAFLLDRPRDLVAWLVLFPLVLAPAEQWLGSARWIATFAVGHIGATLATAAVVWLAIHRFAGDTSLARAEDVGASYGFLAVAGLFTFALHGRARVAYAAVLWAAVVGAVAFAGGIANLGHCVALLLGYVAWIVAGPPLSRGRRGNWPSTQSATTPARGRPKGPS